MSTWYHSVIERPRTIFFLVALLTAISSVPIARGDLRFDSAPTTLTSVGDPAWERLDRARRTFGDDRLIILAIEQPDVLNAETLRKIDRLTSELSSLRGVSQVLSLTNVQQVGDNGYTLRVENLVSLPLPPERAGRVRDRLTRDPLFLKHLVSRDLRVTALTVFLQGSAPSALVDQVRALAEKEFDPNDLHLVGEPAMERLGSHMMLQDLMTFTPVALLLVAGTFLASFRSRRAMSLPLLAAILTVIWTVGMLAWARRPLTVTTLTLPVLLSAILASYVTHVINQFYLSGVLSPGTVARDERSARAVKGLGFITPAVLVSGTTTFAGFGALAWADIPATRDLGAFGALGVVFGTTLALTLVPSALAFARRAPRDNSGQRSYGQRLNRPLLTIARWANFYPTRIHIMTSLLCLLALVGLKDLRVHTNYLNFSRADSEIRRAVAFFQEKLAGAASFQFVIETDSPGHFRDLQGLNDLMALEDYVRENRGIDATLSIADVVQSVAWTEPVGGIAPQMTAGLGLGRPIDNPGISVRDLFRDLLDQDPTTRRLISADGSKALIFVRSRLFGSTEMNQVIDIVESWARSKWPDHRVYATGTFVLLNHTSDAVARNQIRSLGLALLSILTMVSMLFRSLRLGLLALIPNLLPVVGFFGVMGWTQTPLDINTSLVASIVLGLAVDNAVHLIWRYRARLKDGLPESEALERSLLETGKPMLFANATLALAFSVFALSNFPPVRIEGWLAGFTITACLLADLIFLPALMRAGIFRTAWPSSVRDLTTKQERIACESPSGQSPP